MTKIKFIYADLQRTHLNKNEIRLDTYGTQRALKKHGIEFKEGEEYWFWRDDDENDTLIFSGKVKFDRNENFWIAVVDPNSIQHLSDSQFSGVYSVKDIEEGAS